MSRPAAGSNSPGSLKVSEQLVQLGWKVEAGKAKSEAGDRTIGLDDVTNNVLEAWRKRQIAEQLAYGPGWTRSGRIFTRTDGAELHPAEVDIKVVQELLGHSTSVLTRDTYTSVSPRLAKEAAEKAAKMVPRRAS